MSAKRPGRSRRDVLKGAAAAAAAGMAGLRVPVVLGQAKPFAGKMLNVSAFTHVHQNHVKELLPEFEQKTGIKVNLDTQAFPIYNQRADLELSTKGQAYDVLGITYIYAARWIGAGWFFSLDEFLNDRNRTPPEWDAADFDPASMTPLKDAKGKIYGFPWEQSSILMAAARADLLEKAGLKMPETLKELEEAVAKIHNVDGVAGYVSHTTHHWVWVPYLMALGGKVFKDSPDNLTPTLDTDVAGEAMQLYGDLLRKYSPSGVLSFQDAQAMQVQLNGRANFRTQSVAWLTPLATDPKSNVRKTVRFGLMPAGPAGRFPGGEQPWMGYPRRRQTEGGRLGVHQVGRQQGDHPHDDRARLYFGRAALGHALRSLQAKACVEWARCRGHD